MDPDWYEWMLVVGGLGTAVATAFLAYFAVSQLRLLAVDSARQTRPYVNVDVSPGLQGLGFWDLTIENVGRTIALNVLVDAGPLLAKDDDDHISEALSKFLSRSFILPPGSARRLMWRMEADEKHGRTVAGVDAEREVTVTYTDDQRQTRPPRGHRRLRKKRPPYVETFHIDVSTYGTISPGPNVGATTVSTSKSPEFILEDINKALRVLNTHVGMLRK